MFTDGRSKKVVFIAHCLLNQNSISDGTAVSPACCKEVIELLISSGIGIIQMPCPELMCLGLDRNNPDGCASLVVEENTRIRAAMGTMEMVQKIQALVQFVIYQIKAYKKHHFQIIGIIGVNRSPSCGVETTSDNNLEIEGTGVFIESLINALKKHVLEVKVVGIKPTQIEEAVKSITALLPLD